MPATKNPYRRYQIINGLLRSYRQYTLKEISEKVNEQLAHDGLKNVSERMIYNDIQNIRNEYPVEIKNVNGKFFYEDRNDTIENIPLTNEDKEVLEMALQTFSLYKGSPFFDKFNSTINRLMAGSVLRKLQKEDPSIYIQIGEMTGDTGQTWLEVLYNAITDQKCLVMHYQSYESTTKIRTITPYLLKEYRNQWYLVAYCREIGDAGSTNIFKLNRIRKIEPSDDVYYEDVTFKKDDYFKYTLGVFHKKDADPVVIKLQFKRFLVQLILENKIHPTMEIISHKEDELTVSIKVYNTIELKNLILSYGSNVTVLEPEELRNDIILTANAIRENYTDHPNH
jgi:predicted DNA-binding transcriptional regulator YafY